MKCDKVQQKMLNIEAIRLSSAASVCLAILTRSAKCVCAHEPQYQSEEISSAGFKRSADKQSKKAAGVWGACDSTLCTAHLACSLSIVQNGAITAPTVKAVSGKGLIHQQLRALCKYAITYRTYTCSVCAPSSAWETLNFIRSTCPYI